MASSEISAGTIVRSCSRCFLLLLETPEAFCGNDSLHPQLRVQAQRFGLWADNFNADRGGLDPLLATSEQLRHTVLTLLAKIGQTLIDFGKNCVAQDLAKSKDFTSALNELEQRIIEDNDFIQHMDKEAPTSRGTSDSDSSDSSMGPTSPEQDPDHTIDDITLYNDLLSDLVPALRSSTKNKSLEPDTAQVVQMTKIGMEAPHPSAAPQSLKYHPNGLPSLWNPYLTLSIYPMGSIFTCFGSARSTGLRCRWRFWNKDHQLVVCNILDSLALKPPADVTDTELKVLAREILCHLHKEQWRSTAERFDRKIKEYISKSNDGGAAATET